VVCVSRMNDVVTIVMKNDGKDKRPLVFANVHGRVRTS
jgi:hypothetical protein